MKRSNILLNVPSLSALRLDDIATHDIRLQDVSPGEIMLSAHLASRAPQKHIYLCALESGQLAGRHGECGARLAFMYRCIQTLTDVLELRRKMIGKRGRCMRVGKVNRA